MQALKVIIENWQKVPWFITWVPLIVGVIAVFVSWYSIYLARIQFRQSTRPYVAAFSYRHIPTGQIINNMVIYGVLNGPARIKSISLKLSYKDDIFSDTVANLVRFPNDNSEWTYQFNHDEFKRLELLAKNDGENFIRTVEIHYTHLNGGDPYYFKISQKYTGDGPTWKNFSEDAN